MDVGEVEFEIRGINGHWASSSGPMYKVAWESSVVPTQNCAVYLQQIVDMKPLRHFVTKIGCNDQSKECRIFWRHSWVHADTMKAEDLIAQFEESWARRT